MNKILLIGNLGRDPEMSYTPNGVAVTKFSLAVSRTFKTQSGERQEETEWFNVTAWRQQAEICNTYLRKGSKVYIEGRLKQRKYTDREGAQRTSLDVEMTEMEMLTPKGTQGGGSGSGSGSNPDYLNNDGLGEIDEHPF